MRRRRARAVGEGFWISYSDLTTGLLLIFIVLVAAMIAHYRERQEAVLGAVDDLLLVRSQLAQRLKLSAEQANERLGYGAGDPRAFRYDALRQQVLIQEGAWFDPGEATLKPEAGRAIDAFFPVLYDLVLSGEVDPETGLRPLDYLAAIEIQGHTDASWAAAEPWSWEGWYRNALLSQERAAEVAARMGELAQEQGGRDWRPFFAYVHASGRSWSESYCQGEVLEPASFRAVDPCPEGRTAEDDPRSRRVTFGIRLDSEEVIRRVREEVRAAREAP